MFILLDRPDVVHDRRLSAHIMNSHNLTNKKNSSIDPHLSKNHIDENSSLSDRLHDRCGRVGNQTIPPEFLKAYIGYARKYIHPRLTTGAAKILQKLYLNMRAKSNIGEGVPVTTRHLESLIRLSQARAKSELRDVVNESDAQEVVELLTESLIQAFTDNIGQVDHTRKNGISAPKSIKALVIQLRKESEISGNNIFHRNQIKEIAQLLRLDRDIDELITAMNEGNYLLMKGGGNYQLMAN